jgi:3-deoxy-manno-octulosonate cytidylyltransferase (CMP-KDO synthetase)
VSCVGVIPARFASTRLPGKSLRKILDKPLLQWVIEGAQTATALDEIIVATDHEEIFQLAESLGVKAVMTHSDLPSGSDRIWAAIKDLNVDTVINIQGDEPLIKGALIDKLVEAMRQDSAAEMGTLANAIRENELQNKNVVKVILNKNSDAIYFSRFGMPYSRISYADQPGQCLKHVGMYAYKKEFLKKFCEAGVSGLEQSEGLEQLRALHLGARIKVVPVEYECVGVDVEDDIIKVEEILKKSR